MRDGGNTTSFILPPPLLAEVEAAADEEHRPAADLVRDLVAQGLDERRWNTQVEDELRRSRELGLAEDGQHATGDNRRIIREQISQGLMSAREGRLVDGDVVFARLLGELDQHQPPE